MRVFRRGVGLKAEDLLVAGPDIVEAEFQRRAATQFRHDAESWEDVLAGGMRGRYESYQLLYKSYLDEKRLKRQRLNPAVADSFGKPIWDLQTNTEVGTINDCRSLGALLCKGDLYSEGKERLVIAEEHLVFQGVPS